MSLLSEVAGRADVPVEGVVRVVTRQPVSRRIEQRVLTVLDALEPEQLRSLERLALAAAPTVLPVGAERPKLEPAGTAGPDNGGNGPAPPPPSPEPRSTPQDRSLERFGRNGASSLSEADRVTAQLGALLEDIVHSLNDMRRDVLADRRDRVDDLAVLVDLLTTSWRGVDRRLGRIERSLARLDAAREARPQIPLQPAPPPPEPPPEPPVAALPAEPPADEEEQAPSRARRLATMLGTPLLFLGALAAALLTFELMASSSDDPRLGPPPDVQPTTSLSSTTGGTPTVTESRQPTTQPTTQPSTQPTTTQPTTPATTATTPTTTGTGSSFTPARVFAWPAAENAAYYHVRFFRGENLIYQAWPTRSRLTLPETVVFAPGSYRWNVRPGIGPRAQNRFGRPIIDSTFEVES